ncbi:hypothetical protein Tco_1054445 [Tanacetum coccineum]|uniref:Uncharacterized protein n=1 Tax=Tanacetum coccineum TaxID=301880 RepID=A0ABQ5GWW3_9ASTR
MWSFTLRQSTSVKITAGCLLDKEVGGGDKKVSVHVKRRRKAGASAATGAREGWWERGGDVARVCKCVDYKSGGVLLARLDHNSIACGIHHSIGHTVGLAKGDLKITESTSE